MASCRGEVWHGGAGWALACSTMGCLVRGERGDLPSASDASSCRTRAAATGRKIQHA
jgi:hypothetical protein